VSNLINPIKTADISELSKILNGLVFDRTQSDADYAVSLMRNGIFSDQELKGAYNISDRKRVSSAAKYINECIRASGNYEARIKIKDDWREYDIVKHEDNEAVLTALRYLKSCLTDAKTPEVPESLENLSYVTANVIEQILYELCRVIERYVNGWFYFGEAFASDFDAFNWQGWDS
jgi:hypothetical protein